MPDDETPLTILGFSRAQRLLKGWSANLFQLLLGITQQIALIPIFLQFWTSDMLAAWLTIYAAGNLVLVVDSGLHVRAINRFFALKSSVDCDGRTASFYASTLRIYVLLVGSLVVLLTGALQLFPPSANLGFLIIPQFDPAFGVMTLGMLLTIPANVVTALYRARGLYGRAVGLQSCGMLIAQLFQLAAVGIFGTLLAVTLAYVLTQILVMIYFVALDAPRLFPFLRGAPGKRSWRWIAGQFRAALPFAVAGTTELVLANAPVLLVSAFVSDRIAVAQWGLTRVVAGLLRALCTQTTLPLAAELGHDYALGLKEQLRGLYARGSILVSLLAGIVTSGLLAFWPDFFEVWTHGAIPYNTLLAVTLMVGTAMAAPSILASSFANYCHHGKLLASTKALQLVVFLVLAFLLVPILGPLGAAVAIVASDLGIQFGLLTVRILRQTLEQPLRHVALLILVVTSVTLGGWGLGVAIRWAVPGTGFFRLIAECTLWLVMAVLIASPLRNSSLRNRLASMIPC